VPAFCFPPLLKCVLLFSFVPPIDPSVSPTAARPGLPAGSALPHDREPGEDVPQADEAAWEAVPADDSGRRPHAHE